MIIRIMANLIRTLDLRALLQKKSFFLFGPRATGKSYLISKLFNQTSFLIIDLLESDKYLRLSSEPHKLENLINSQEKVDLVVIDEVQRIPELLNEVHRLIEKRQFKFLLTGSSARKLKRAQANLLAGRAWEAQLFPLTYREIPKFDLQRYLCYGGLPPVYLSEEPLEELRAYVSTYLREEIQAEAVVRKIPAFSRFLKFSSLTCGNMINFSSVANDASVPITTIREYYQILEDTFIGFLLPAWTKTVKRKPITTAKFYYFDVGVKNILAEIYHVNPNTSLFGQVFEHFIAMELRAYLSYTRSFEKLAYWCAKNGQEVDFIVGDRLGIEVKATEKITAKHLRGIIALKEENLLERYIIVSQDKINQNIQGIECLYWKDFLQAMYEQKII